jgi:hypothetical protein
MPKASIPWRLRITLAVILALTAAVSASRAASAPSSDCTFVLGFAQLHALLPDVVGACLEDEHHNPSNGDALQRTSGGLLVWRKADNWTAFTDGYRTWINGPLGLQDRPNDQRFWWEPNPDHLAIVPTPQPGERCHTAQLDLSLNGVHAGAGNFVGTFDFTNAAPTSCTFQGYPGAELRDAADQPLPTQVVWGGGYFSNQPAPQRVLVAPGGQAEFDVHWEQVPVGDERSCPLASILRVTPPDEYSPIPVVVEIRACGGGHLDVSAIRPAEPGSTSGEPLHAKIALVQLVVSMFELRPEIPHPAGQRAVVLLQLADDAQQSGQDGTVRIATGRMARALGGLPPGPVASRHRRRPRSVPQPVPVDALLSWLDAPAGRPHRSLHGAVPQGEGSGASSVIPCA